MLIQRQTDGKVARLWDGLRTATGTSAVGWYAALLLVCIVSRVVSTIYYIEDTDSLRFALAVLEYDVVRLQPHFPGYPVFCFLARLLYVCTGSFAVSFSILGGCATFVIAVVLLQFGRAVGLCAAPFDAQAAGNDRTAGGILLALVLFNPLFWLMGNRYMPDLSGLACLLAALYFLVVSGHRAWGIALSGLLAGIRLSYVPMLLLPLGLALLQAWRNGILLQRVGWLVVGVVVWLVPLVVVTGWDELLVAASRQTEGHFTEFGGTILTEGTLIGRCVQAAETVLVDGLGMYMPGRHPLTLVTTVGVLAAWVLSIPMLLRAHGRRVLVLMLASWGMYLLWVVLFQNVLHKNRHILPLLPVLLLMAAAGLARLVRWQPAAILAAATLLCYGIVSTVLVAQHRTPTAIAQVHRFLRFYDGDSLTVVAVPLVNYYLSGQQLRAVYIAADDPQAAARVRERRRFSRVVSVGNYESLLGEKARRVHTFYHNPLVNRMWPEVQVYEFYD